ncbi:MAG: hypothetical protein R6V41_03525 [Desulfobacteraceae bacterium]
MKGYSAAGIILFAVFLFAACGAYTPVQDKQAYYDGVNTAERLAKQDAIDEGCFHYPATTKGMRLYREHRDRLQETKGADFLKGFRNRYKDAFREYMELYCGNGDHDGSVLQN